MYTTSQEVYIKMPNQDRNTYQISLDWSLSTHVFYLSEELTIKSASKIEKMKKFLLSDLLTGIMN